MSLRFCCDVFCLFILTELGLTSSAGWEYIGDTGPKHWPSLYSICGRSSQSPIDIKTKYLYPNPNLGSLTLRGYSETLSGGTFTNNGHTAQLNFPKGKKFQLSGEGINGTYTALQLHFHWISENSSKGGSEHTVNGHHYDAEMHIVHIKNPFASVDDIKSMKDGLAVLGVFLKADENAADNQNYQSLLETAAKCHFKGDKADLANGSTLLSLLPDSGTYYRYYGSLTTPPCYETVLWTVYEQPVVISQQQLGIFQKLSTAPNPENEGEKDEKSTKKLNEILADNYRPVRELNGRIVSIYHDVDISESNEHGWDYIGQNDPSRWSRDYAQCNGTRQSPIDFRLEDSIYSQTLKHPRFSKSYSQATSGELSNNGHTVLYTLDEKNKLDFTVNDKTYRALQLHFHWGTAEITDYDMSYRGGSEHTVNGKHYPVEMHIVHKKEKSDNHTGDDLAVLGIFFDVGNTTDAKANLAVQNIADTFLNIGYKDKKVAIANGPTLEDFFPHNKSYYRYEGSLTTPPCSETVMWTVFVYPVIISFEKFLEFQNLFKMMMSDVHLKNSTKNDLAADTDEMSVLEKLLLVNNFRPTQDRNSREVQIYIEKEIVLEKDVVSIVLFSVLGITVFAGILAMMIFCKQKESAQQEDELFSKVTPQIEIDDKGEAGQLLKRETSA